MLTERIAEVFHNLTEILRSAEGNSASRTARQITGESDGNVKKASSSTSSNVQSRLRRTVERLEVVKASIGKFRLRDELGRERMSQRQQKVVVERVLAGTVSSIWTTADPAREKNIALSAIDEIDLRRLAVI